MKKRPGLGMLHVTERALIVGALAVGVTMGCRERDKAETKATNEVTAKKPVPSAAPSPSVPLEWSDSAKPKGLSPQEKEAIARYHAAMSKGRKLTLDKSYDDAIAAFDQALAARKDDPRALTERGYAKLLAKRWAPAIIDLERARGRTKDHKLQAQVWFNLGLAYEGLARDDDARRAFAKSNELHPTEAAKKKLGEKAVCAVAPRFDRVIGGSVHEGWLALWKTWSTSYKESWDVPPGWADPKSDEEAKKESCVGCDGSGPYVATFGAPYVQSRWRLVVPQDGKKLLAFDDEDDGTGGRCAWTTSFPRLEQKGDLVLVEQHEQAQEMTYVKESNGALVDCNPTDADCMSACVGVTVTITTHIFDIAQKKRLARVEQSSPPDAKRDWEAPVTVTLDEAARSIELRGAGCDGVTKLP